MEAEATGLAAVMAAFESAAVVVEVADMNRA